MKVACHGTDHPPMNITNALAESCNAYFCEMFYRLVKSKKTSIEGVNIWVKLLKGISVLVIFLIMIYTLVFQEKFQTEISIIKFMKV